MTAPPKRQPTRVPLAPSGDPQSYLTPLHQSLYTRPDIFTPTYSGLTGVTGITATLVRTARSHFISILISGATIALSASVQTKVYPVTNSSLQVLWLGPPTYEIDSAQIDVNGNITLPDWNVYNSSMLITGLITEG